MKASCDRDSAEASDSANERGDTAPAASDGGQPAEEPEMNEETAADTLEPTGESEEKQANAQRLKMILEREEGDSWRKNWSQGVPELGCPDGEGEDGARMAVSKGGNRVEKEAGYAPSDASRESAGGTTRLTSGLR